MEFENSKTKQNLIEAFIGESKARNKYSFYCEKAKEEGYFQIGEIFKHTADNEREHAKIWFKLLCGGEIQNTVENLKDAIEAEHFETSEMYVNFAKVAKEEGFDKIAFLFENVAKIEKTHEERYKKLLDNIEKGEVFEKSEAIIWECINCGYSYLGNKAHEKCPFCAHPKSYFEEKANNY